MLPVRTIDEIRHENLLTLLGRFTTLQAFADRIERPQSQVSQLKNRSAHSKTGARRTIDSKLARHIEERLELTPGWMDNDHTRTGWPFPDIDRAQWDALPPGAKAQVQKGLRALLAQFGDDAPADHSFGQGELTTMHLHEPSRKPYRTGSK